MKNLSRMLFVLVVLASATGCSPLETAAPDEPITATAATPDSPEGAVLAFYAWYLDGMGETRDDGMNQLLSDRGYRGHSLITQAFSAKVDSILEHFQEAGSRDPFLCGFDAPGTISAQIDNEDGVNAGVDLLLADTGVTLRIALIQEDGGWRISDVSCP